MSDMGVEVERGSESLELLSRGCADQSVALVQLRLVSANSGGTTREHDVCGQIDD